VVAPFVVLAACNRNVVTTTDTIEWTGPIAEGAQVAIRSRNGSVTVDSIAGDSAVITLTVRRPRGVALPRLEVLRDTADGIVGCVLFGEDGTCSLGDYDADRSMRGVSVTAVVRIPRGRRLDVATSNARIVVNAPTTGAVLRTSNASIRAIGVAGPLTASSSNGSLRAERVAGPMTLTTSNASIRVIADTLGGPIEASSSNGSITAWLPPTASARLAMSTSNGSVTLDLPGNVTGRTRSTLDAVLGAGTHAVTMRSSNGSLSVKPRSEAPVDDN
jgi:DUF4097 and DUF4098 domain-containing protein YvlB